MLIDSAGELPTDGEQLAKEVGETIVSREKSPKVLDSQIAVIGLFIPVTVRCYLHIQVKLLLPFGQKRTQIIHV